METFDSLGRRALVLINPGSRSGKVESLRYIEALEIAGIKPTQVVVEKPDGFQKTIEKYKKSIDYIIAGGGDGSMNAAVTALHGLNIPLGILPLGTANNLARNLGIAADPQEASRVIAQGQTKRIDVGWVNGRYFLNVAGMGLSTQINRTVPGATKKRWGVLAYVYWAFKILRRAHPFWAEIHSKDHSVCVRSLQIVICNGRFYGSGLTIAPDAVIDDQQLDLCSMEARNWWEGLRLIPSIKRGTHNKCSLSLPLRAGEFHIRTKHPLVIDTDGEVSTTTPAHFKVIPQAIQIFVPSEARDVLAS